MVKRKVNLYVEERLWEEFKRLSFSKHGKFHGALSGELEQAIQSWLAQHTQNHTKQLVVNKVNPQPKVYRVFAQVKEYLKQRYGYAAIVPGQQVPRKHLVEAIAAIRGSHPQTIESWMNNFVMFKLIKWIAGELYEVI